MPTGIRYQANEDDRLRLIHGLQFGLTVKFIAQNMGLSINTLKAHYPDIIEAAQLAGGHRFQPTKEQRNLVTMAAAVGLRHEDIAELLRVSRSTVETHFSEELSLGTLRASLRVGNNLFKIATADPPLPGTVTAAIWWTKARMGWRSTTPAEKVGVYGAKIAAHIVIVPQTDGAGGTSVPLVADCGEALLRDAEPNTAGEAPCEEPPDIQLCHDRASHWRELAAATSNMTLHAAYVGIARAYERLAFLADCATKSTLPRTGTRTRV
jgi:hypothetical protein